MIVTGERGVRVRARVRRRRARARDRCGASSTRRWCGAAVAAGARVRGRRAGARPARWIDDGAASAGVVIAGRDGRDVRVPAPLVIAADGRRSRLALPLGLARHPRRPRRWAIGAYFEDVAGLTSFGEMHVRRGRYLGVAPRAVRACANVCLVRRPRGSAGARRSRGAAARRRSRAIRSCAIGSRPRG